MRRNKRSRIKDTRPRPYQEPVQSPDGKTYIKGLPVPHIPIPDGRRVGPATSDDITNRIEYQLKKYDDLKKDGKLTSEWRTFGERHGKE